jgi:integrase
MTESRTARYWDLKVIPGHKNFYRNSLSQKITYQRKGIRIRTGVTQITKAKEIVEAELAKRLNQTMPVRKRLHGVSNPLIKDVWDLLMEDKKAESRPSTIRTYNKNWSIGLDGFWGEKYVSDLTQENIAEFKRWTLRTHPTRYFEKTLIHFKWLLKGIKKAGYIAEMPDVSILDNVEELTTKAAKRTKVGRVLKDVELKALFEAAAAYVAGDDRGVEKEHKAVLGLRAQLGVALGAKCGMRKMEAMGLEWANIDLKNGIAKVWSDKNANWREVPLVPTLRDLFKKQFELTGSSRYVFPMPTDPARHISGQVFDKVWIKVKRDAKIKGRLRFHDLRHTFASMTANDGWPHKVACEILDMSMAIYDKVYAKASAEKKVEWVNRTFGESK